MLQGGHHRHWPCATAELVDARGSKTIRVLQGTMLLTRRTVALGEPHALAATV